MSLHGFGLLLGAAFLFSIMSWLVKWAGETLPSSMLVCARAIVTLVSSYVWLRFRGISPWGNRRGLLILRGLFGFTGLTCFFYTLTRLPLAEATVLQYLNPVFTAVVAFFVLREPLRLALVGALGLAFLGVILIANPALSGVSSTLPKEAVAVAVCGALASAGAYVTIRKLRESDEPLVIVFYFSLVALPVSVPVMMPSFVWPQGIEWLLLLALGLVTQVAQVMMTRGLALVPAGPGTTVGYTQIGFSTLWGWLVFQETPSVATGMGALCIGLAIGLLWLPQRNAPGR